MSQAPICRLCLRLSRHQKMPRSRCRDQTPYSEWFVADTTNTLPEVAYPTRWGNKTASKKCIFDGCQTTSKKLRMHVEKKHLPWYLSRQCFNLERAAGFLKSLGQKLGVSSFSALLKLVKEQQLYPPKESTKEISSQDQEIMQQFERYVSGRRANFQIQVSPPNCCGSLLHWRLLAGLMIKHPTFQGNNRWSQYYMVRLLMRIAMRPSIKSGMETLTWTMLSSCTPVRIVLEL